MLNKNLSAKLRKIQTLVVLLAFLFTGMLFLQSCTTTEEGEKTSSERIDRTVLPIKEPIPPTSSELDVRNVKVPPQFKVEAPKRCT